MIRESFQEAEEGRFREAGPVRRRGGIPPPTPPSDAKKGGAKREVQQCLELLSILLVLIKDDLSSSGVLGLNLYLCHPEPTNLWRPSSEVTWFGVTEAVV